MLHGCAVDAPPLIRGGTCAGHLRRMCGSCAAHPNLYLSCPVSQTKLSY